MAETSAANRAETPTKTVLTPATNAIKPERNKGGRPRKDGQPPGSPQTKSEPKTAAAVNPDFFAYLKTFAPAEWNDALTLYLYRTTPELNMARRGQMNIQKFNRPVDADEIMQLHGSGGYKFILNRYDSKTLQSGAIREHYFQIMNMEFPPRVPYGSWIDRPENAEWLWAKPALMKALQDANNSIAGGGNNNATTIAQVADLIERIRPNNSPEEQATLAQLVVQTMQEQNKQVLAMANPNAMLEIVDKVLASTASKGSSGDVMIELLKEQLNRMHTELMDERKAAREAANSTPKQPSLKEALAEQKEIIDLMGIKRGQSGTDWTSVAVDIGRDLVKALTTIGTAVAQHQIQKANLEMQRKQNATPATATRQPAAQPPAIAAAEPTPQPAATVAPGSTLPPQETDDVIANISQQFAQLFDPAAPFLVDHFRKGWSGMEFRDWFLDTYGRMGYNAVKSMSKETLIGVLEHRKNHGPDHVREVLFELQPPEKVAQFVDEFLSDRPVPDDDPELEGEDNEDPHAPEPARRNAGGARDEF